MYFLKMRPSGSIYTQNKSGPCTDPCGTPLLIYLSIHHLSIIGLSEKKEVSPNYDKEKSIYQIYQYIIYFNLTYSNPVWLLTIEKHMWTTNLNVRLFV